MKNWIEQIWNNNRQERLMPDRKISEDFIQGLFDLMFINQRSRIYSLSSLMQAFEFRREQLTLLVQGGSAVALQFFDQLPDLDLECRMDAEALWQSDPAASSIQEVLHTYPGFRAVAIYRLAHALWKLEEFSLSRMLTEYAHAQTGIDIHPGAKIGSGFAIDHGTGIVIGATAVIGKKVKMYQGVTLGALSVAKEKAGIKRHPTIEDEVVIYANATILGGDTIIGKGSRIGGNVWLTQSVPPGSVVQHASEVRIRDVQKFPEAIHFVI